MLLNFKIFKVFVFIIEMCCAAQMCGFPGEGVKASLLLDRSEVFGFLITASWSKHIQWIFYTAAKINAADNPGPGMSSSSGYRVSV